VNYIKTFSLALFLLLAACSSVPEKDSLAGNTRVKQAIPPGAEQQYQQALAAIDQQDWPSAQTVLLSMQNEFPQLASVSSTLGWVYRQQGDIEKAQAVLEPLIGNPTLYKPDAYMNLALIYREQGLFKKAEALYDQAVVIWPDDADLHINAGILQDLYLGQLAKALAHYQQAQAASTQRNRTLEGWIKDLERRI